MMEGIDYGCAHFEADVPEKRLVGIEGAADSTLLEDLAQAVSQALERPSGFPALKKALTPDDHVAIILGGRLPRFLDVLVPILEHVAQAHIEPEAITVVSPATLESASWINDLPQGFRGVRQTVHDPENRKLLSYLATTKKGRRIYLNRTVVDADQVVVVSSPSYDPLLGYGGCEGAIFPALSDLATQREMVARLSMVAPGAEMWPVRREAAEVTWLLGAPFMLQVIYGRGDHPLHVLGGLADTAGEGIRLHNHAWRITVDRLADIVVAGVSGRGNSTTFSDLGAALACASRVVKPQGKVVLLSQAAPALGPGAEVIRQSDSPDGALQQLKQADITDAPAAFQWASSAKRANLYLLSELAQDVAEELFTTPLDHPAQVERLLASADSCAFISEADKTLAVVRVGTK
jgi:nickel-dependent lactate racemase